MIARILAYSLLGWFFLDHNPFGISDQTDLATQKALYKITAPYYVSDAQNDITIVLLNQTSITELYNRSAIEANEWPIRYRDHGYLLSRIIKRRPKAVFVDIYFKQERSTDDSFDQLKRQLQRLSEKYEVPILFSGGYHDEVYSEFQQDLSDLGELTISGWQDYGSAYPLIDGGKASTAYRLYQIACGGAQPLDSCKPPGLNLPQEGDAISVRWGSRAPNTIFPEFSQDSCLPAGNSALEMGEQFLLGFTQGLTSYDDSTAAQSRRCAYHPVIFADELVYVDKNGSTYQEQRLAQSIENKIVIYGLSLEGLHDNVTSPVHGLLPGLFFHAMALDNIMHYGSDYIRAADDTIALFTQITWICTVILFSAILLIMEKHGYNFSNDQPEKGKGKRVSTWVMVCAPAAIIIPISIGMFLLGRYEPLNSVGFLVLIGVSSILIRNDFVEGALSKIYLAASPVFGLLRKINYSNRRDFR